MRERRGCGSVSWSEGRGELLTSGNCPRWLVGIFRTQLVCSRKEGERERERKRERERE